MSVVSKTAAAAELARLTLAHHVGVRAPGIVQCHTVGDSIDNQTTGLPNNILITHGVCQGTIHVCMDNVIHDAIIILL